MWNGKNKAVTFSFDDGLTHDKRIIKVFNKYGIKATFNLNSANFGAPGSYVMYGKTYQKQCVNVEEVKDVYKGHEIASHTMTHPNLTTLNESTIIWQVEQDRKVLSSLVGYEVVGLAYPCGGVNNDERVAKILKEKTGVKYARTITSTYSFDLQENLLQFNPTIYWTESRLYEMIDKFIETKADKPQLLYIWGHGYEIDDTRVDLDKVATYLEKLSKQKDIFFGTNREVFGV